MPAKWHRTISVRKGRNKRESGASRYNEDANKTEQKCWRRRRHARQRLWQTYVHRSGTAIVHWPQAFAPLCCLFFLCVCVCVSRLFPWPVIFFRLPGFISLAIEFLAFSLDRREWKRRKEGRKKLPDVHCPKGETNNNPSGTHFCRTKMTTVPTRHNWMSTAKYQVISRHCEDKRTPRILCSSRVSLWPEIANQYGSTFTPCWRGGYSFTYWERSANRTIDIKSGTKCTTRLEGNNFYAYFPAQINSEGYHYGNVRTIIFTAEC